MACYTYPQNSDTGIVTAFLGGFDRSRLRQVSASTLDAQTVDGTQPPPVVQITIPRLLLSESQEEAALKQFLSEEKAKTRTRAREIEALLHISAGTGSPPNPWAVTPFNYRYHSRSKALTDGVIWTDRLFSGVVVPVGYSSDSFEPVFLQLTKDYNTTAHPGQALASCNNRRLAGEGNCVGLRMGRSNVESVIPVTDLFNKGQVQAIKRFIVNNSQSETKWEPGTEFIDEKRELSRMVNMGFRLWIPSYISVASDPTPSIRNVTLPMPLFMCAGFNTSEEVIPSEAIELIRRFVAKHPNELLYEQAIAQGICLYIRCLLTQDFGKVGGKKKIKHVPIGDFLLVYQAYLVWHQDSDAAVWMHPYTWTWLSFEGRRWEIGYDMELERLLVMMAPLAFFPLAHLLPCSMPGSNQPDLTKGTRYLKPEDEELKKLMNLPDWRLLYFPSFQLKDGTIIKNCEFFKRTNTSFQPELRKLAHPCSITASPSSQPISTSSEIPGLPPFSSFAHKRWKWDAVSSVSDRRAVEDFDIGNVGPVGVRKYQKGVDLSQWSKVNLKKMEDGMELMKETIMKLKKKPRMEDSEEPRMKDSEEDDDPSRYHVWAFGRWMWPESPSKPHDEDEDPWHDDSLYLHDKPMKPLAGVRARAPNFDELPKDGSIPEWATKGEGVCSESSDQENDDSESGSSSNSEDSDDGSSGSSELMPKREREAPLDELLEQIRYGSSDDDEPLEASNIPETPKSPSTILTPGLFVPPRTDEADPPDVQTDISNVDSLNDLDMEMVAPKLIKAVIAHNRETMRRIREERIGVEKLVLKGPFEMITIMGEQEFEEHREKLQLQEETQGRVAEIEPQEDNQRKMEEQQRLEKQEQKRLDDLQKEREQQERDARWSNFFTETATSDQGEPIAAFTRLKSDVESAVKGQGNPAVQICAAYLTWYNSVMVLSVLRKLLTDRKGIPTLKNDYNWMAGPTGKGQLLIGEVESALQSLAAGTKEENNIRLCIKRMCTDPNRAMATLDEIWMDFTFPSSWNEGISDMLKIELHSIISVYTRRIELIDQYDDPFSEEQILKVIPNNALEDVFQHARTMGLNCRYLMARDLTTFRSRAKSRAKSRRDSELPPFDANSLKRCSGSGSHEPLSKRQKLDDDSDVEETGGHDGA